jgi:23S rRNA-/tRNA-specific pseudouridylate synthase
MASKPIKKYVTTKDLMKIYNKNYTQVRYVLRTGKIPSIRVGWQYLVLSSELPEIWPVKD